MSALNPSMRIRDQLAESLIVHRGFDACPTFPISFAARQKAARELSVPPYTAYDGIQGNILCPAFRTDM